MDRRMRIAALMVASLSLAGCNPAARNARASATIEDTSGVRVMVLDPTGPRQATNNAAARANSAAQEQQQTLDELDAK